MKVFAFAVVTSSQRYFDDWVKNYAFSNLIEFLMVREVMDVKGMPWIGFTVLPGAGHVRDLEQIIVNLKMRCMDYETLKLQKYV